MQTGLKRAVIYLVPTLFQVFIQSILLNSYKSPCEGYHEPYQRF